MKDNNPFAPIEGISSRAGRFRRKASLEIDIAPEELRESNPGATLTAPSERLPMRRILFVVLTILVLLASRTLYLQVFRSESLRVTAEGNRIQNKRIPAPRGDIITHDGVVVAKNTAIFEVRIDATLVPKTQDDAVVQSLIEPLGLTAETLKQAMVESRSKRQAIVVKSDIQYSDALVLMVQLRHNAVTQITQQYRREYPSGPLLAHLIGYTSKMTAEEYQVYRSQGYALDAIVGKSGIEKTYEADIHGIDGVERIEVDFKGNPQRIIATQDPLAGKTTHLTIDFELQKKLYEKLQAVVDEKGLPGASAVAIDPRDGSIRALVTYPSYDNNEFTGGISQDVYSGLLNDERKPLLNRPVSGEYPSGSTFKTIVAAAALEEGVVNRDTTVTSTGGLKVDKYIFPDWKAGGHGVTNIIKAIAESVNTYFYLAGGGDNVQSTGLGVERIVSYARRFGLAAKTGIDIPGERPGFLPSKAWKEEFKNEPWYLGDTYHLAIGQGDILVTPLQVASFTAIIANGGTYYQPRLVQGFTDPKTSVETPVQPIIKNQQIMGKESIGIVREGMRATVTSGSARSLSTAVPVPSAGKTGTAQFGKKDKTHAWFAAFAPYDNPTLAIAVLVEEGGGSNDTAVPIAREVLADYFSRPVNGASQDD